VTKNGNSFQDIIKFFDDVSALVDDIFESAFPSSFADTYYEPPIDLFETEEKIFIIMEIAGVKKDDLSIAIGPTMVLIQGIKQRPEVMHQGVSFHNLEIPYGKFKKRIYLPYRVRVKSVEVSLKDGILTMIFNKDKKSVRVIKIE
jgi:HSP20 family protein